MSLFIITFPVVHLLGGKILIQQADSGVCLSKKEVLNYLLEGTAASHLEKNGGEESDAAARTSFSSGMFYILTTH